MERLTATLYRWCNALVIVVLLLGVLPPAQNMRSPRFEPPISHAQEGATTSLEEVMGAPDEADPSPDGPSGQLLAPKMAEPGVVSPGDLITYTMALTNTTGAVDEPEPSADGSSGGLLATKMAEPAVVSLGDLITYTIVLTNTAEAVMEGLVVSDPLPDGLAYLPGSAEGGEYDPRTRTLTWEVGELAAGASLSLSFQARVRGDVLDDLVVNLAEVTGGGLADPVQAQATVAVVSRALITPQGGVLVSLSGRVRVEFPAGAVPDPIWVIYHLLEARQVPASQTGLALRLNLTTQVATDEITAPPITEFEKPVQLTVDMTELVDEAALGQYQRPFVGYLDEATGRWVHLPVVEQQVGPVLTVEVDHFSTFGGGVEGSTDNEGWRLLYNEPQVALFSGAAVYNYPIEVPPGRGGLQPALNLSYNSRRVDGVTNWVESGWAGMGWSVDLMDIVREGIEYWLDNEEWITYTNRFTLLMNGTGYELEPAPEVEAGQPGRYHVKDAPYLYAELREGGDNKIGWYWRVYTPNGTRYQLGYTTNSEQVLYRTRNCKDGPCDAGDVAEYATYRWRLDEAIDVYSNTMQVTYREAQGTGFGQYKDTASVLSEIHYNNLSGGQWASRVTFVGTDFESQPEYKPIFGSQGELQSIEVWHAEQPVRYYALGYYTTTTPASTTIRSLVSIQQFSGDGGQSLPATAFDYEDKWNKGKCDPEANPNCTEWDIEAFPYPRLVQVDNGYGGTAEFDYETDGRGGSWTFYNYRVKARRIYDGIDTAPARAITYTYGTKCYNQTTDNPDDWLQGGVKCRGRSAPYLGPLVGHDWVTETLYSDGTPLVETTHRFYIDDKIGDTPSWRLGREYQTQIYSGLGERLHQTDTTWDSMPISNTTFAHVDQVLATDYSGAETVSTRVDYEYDNYGNLTRQREYANGETQNPYRTSRWEYYPNETDHIVDRVASVGVYVGGSWDLADATWYFYDDNASPTDSPGSKGELTQVARLEVIEPGEVPGEDWPDCVHAYRTSEAEYDYDDYGNITETIAYAGEGYMCQDGGWNVLDRNEYEGKEPAEPQTTTTYYDPGFHQFPVMVTNVRGYTSTIEYYGVNDSECIAAGYHFGAVCRTYGPNGPDTATLYTYDAFGRLEKVIRPGDGEDKPTVLYVYFDDTLEPITPTMRGTWRKHDPNATPWETGGTWVREFFDGLGRLVQVQTPYQDWGGGGVEHDVVRFITYDERGLKASESVGYEKDAYVYDDNCNGTGRICNPYVPPNLNQPQTRYAYDALGRSTAITYPDSTALTTWYDGGQRAVIDAEGHMKVYQEDAFGRLAAVKELTGTHSLPIWADQHDLLYATTTYTYSVLGNLTTVTDTLGYTTTMDYDMLGRKTQMTDPDMGTWSYHYDAAGNLTRQTDALSQTICFYYDDLNRLQGKAYRTDTNCPGYGGYDVTYAYDNYLGDADTAHSWGRRRATWVESPSSNGHEYQYDERGRLIEETQKVNSEAYVTQYTYRADDRVHTMTYPTPPTGSGQAGEVITTTYNAMGLPETLTSSLGETYVTDASYMPEGRLDELSLGSDLRIDHNYFDWNTPNGQGRLESIQSGTVGLPTLLQNLSYGYDAVGNVSRIQDVLAGETLDFSYDPLDRLTHASGAYNESYGYNAIGNLTSKGGVGYDYDDPAHKHAVTHLDQVQKYWYDLNGNMTSRTVDGMTYTLTYDAENRLNSVTQGSETTTFTYDADGRRVKRDTVTDTIVYVGSHYEVRFEEGDKPEDLDGDCLITVVDIMLVVARWGMTSADPDWDPRYDLDGNNVIDVADIMLVAVHWRETCEELAETVKYYTLGGRRVAMRKVPADPPGQVGTVYYLFTDHLGSSNVSYRADGQQTITQRYYPWGTIRPGPSNALPTDYTFTGQKLDESTGLMYYGARYYDPALGRFVQADTIVPNLANPQDLNRYAYVRNNPLKYTDPSGHWLDTVIDIVSISMTINEIRQEGLNWKNGLSLVADVGSLLLPVVAGGGMVIRAATKADDVIDAARVVDRVDDAVDAAKAVDKLGDVSRVASKFQDLTHAADYGLDSVKELTKLTHGKGVEVHHIIGARFAKTIRKKAGDILGVVLTHDEHVKFTKMWRDRIGYNNQLMELKTRTATVEDIWVAAQKVYKNYPELLEAARRVLGK